VKDQFLVLPVDCNNTMVVSLVVMSSTVRFFVMLGQDGDVDKERELQFIEETRKKKCCASDCLNKFPVDVIYSCREQCRELQIRCDQHVSHLHLVLLGHMDACLHDSEETSCAKKKNVERSRTRLTSTFRGVPVCTDAFHFIHGISRRVTRDLKQQFEQHGFEPRVMSKRHHWLRHYHLK